jgi:hypothetical protein
LWRRPRPKLGCGAEEEEEKYISLCKELVYFRNLQTLFWKRLIFN